MLDHIYRQKHAIDTACLQTKCTGMTAPAASHCIAYLCIVKPSALVTQVFNRETRKTWLSYAHSVTSLALSYPLLSVLLPSGCHAADPDGLPTSGSPCCRSCTFQAKLQIKTLYAMWSLDAPGPGYYCTVVARYLLARSPSPHLWRSHCLSCRHSTLSLSLSHTHTHTHTELGQSQQLRDFIGTATCSICSKCLDRINRAHTFIKPDAPDTQWVKGDHNSPSFVPNSWPHQQSPYIEQT